MINHKYIINKNSYIKLLKYDNIIIGGNKEKEFIYIRHGELPTQQLDKEIKDEWINSDRYKQNQFDQYLTKKGINDSYETGKNLIKYGYINIDNIDFIYSSPWTRCIETSIQITKAIKNESNRDIKIRIEYGLAENGTFGEYYLPKINGDKITDDIFPDFIHKNKNNEIVSVLDSELEYSILKNKYSDYLDLNYKPLFTINDVNNCNLKKQWEMYLSTTKFISDQNKSSIVVSHSLNTLVISTQYYLLQLENISTEITEELTKNTKKDHNFVFIYKQNYNGKWMKILDPQRIIQN